MHAAQQAEPLRSPRPSIAVRPQSLAQGSIRNFTLAGPAGALESVLNQGAAGARFAALVCHPHPLGGGNLHNKVVYHAMKALNDPAWGLSLPVLRFNFRGTGLSQGTHDGTAETGDVLAAMDWLDREFHLPLIVTGFSFGAAMALRACHLAGPPHRNVRALIALGLPTAAPGRAYEYSFLRDLTIPKLFLSGDRDQFATEGQLKQIAAFAAQPRRLALLPGCNHFFTDQLLPMQRALSAWLKEQLS